MIIELFIETTKSYIYLNFKILKYMKLIILKSKLLNRINLKKS